jgi:hypothetical protein
MSIWRGPQQGFAANFLSLACNHAIDADLYFFSDQDDIWKAEKIDRAAHWLACVPDDEPALYCSRTQLIDEHGGLLGYSPLFKRRPCFANALAQNVGGGNTMAFNRAARNLLIKAGSQIQIVAHDWWTYLLVSACGGRVHYDSHPSILYRQHGSNLIGANKSTRARLYRLNMLLNGHLKTWNDTHIQALMPLESMMTPENRSKLNCFSRARNRSLFPRILGILESGIYRQTVIGNIGFAAAALFNRV